MIIYFRVEKERLERKRIAEMSKGVGKPKVGGPFTLKDLDGKEFTAEDLKGRYSFVSIPSLPSFFFMGLGLRLICSWFWGVRCILDSLTALISAPTSWTRWPRLLIR